MKNWILIFTTTILAILFSAEVVIAQDKKAAAPKRATVSFDDELVDGSSSKPELFYLFQKKNFNYKRLLKLRENFIPEMKRTSEEIQRVRGAN